MLDVDGCKYQYQFNENNPHNIDDAYLSCGAHAWMHAPFRLGSWAVYRFLLCMIVAVIFIIFLFFTLLVSSSLLDNKPWSQVSSFLAPDFLAFNFYRTRLCCLNMCVLHLIIKLIFSPIYIQHNQCPCRRLPKRNELCGHKEYQKPRPMFVAKSKVEGA